MAQDTAEKALPCRRSWLLRQVQRRLILSAKRQIMKKKTPLSNGSGAVHLVVCAMHGEALNIGPVGLQQL